MKGACVLGLLAAVLGPAAVRPAAAQPAAFQSVRILQTVDPDFPVSLYRIYNHGGTARLALNVDDQGRLKDWLVIGYSAPAFADLALAAVRQWRFEPARWRGEPVPACLTLAFTFTVQKVVISITGNEGMASFLSTALDQMTGRRLYTLDELDRLPAAVRQDAPHYAKALADRGAAGDVEIGFYIDEAGAVRMPFLVSWPEANLANLAMDAVQHWRFEPPRRGGRPVIAYAEEIVRFNPAGTP
jgi:TonB family protein